jgi:choline dehydrogenase-like flavoprotein
MKTFNYEYIICGFGNSTLGCILGIVEKHPRSRILVIEKMSEEEFFSDKSQIKRENVIFMQNSPNNSEKVQKVKEFIEKKNDKWKYSNIIGLEQEYNEKDWYEHQKALDSLNKKYKFDCCNPTNTEQLIEQNFQQYQKSKVTLVKSCNRWNDSLKDNFVDTIKHLIKEDMLEIVFEATAERIVFNKYKAEKLIVSKDGIVENYIIPDDLILGCGSRTCTELLFMSGIGEKELLTKNGVEVVIENDSIGKNLILNPYAELYYREQPKNHFFISQIEFILNALERLIFTQILIGVASYFLYNLLYTNIAISDYKYKILSFILLAGFDSFFLFVFRWNNYMIVGYLLGFCYVFALFVIDSRYYVRSIYYFFLYWGAYYVFYLFFVFGYYRYVGSRLNFSSKNALNIYTNQTILSFYKNETYDRIIRSGRGTMYKFLNILFYITYYYLWTRIWVYKELFVVRVELYHHKYNAFYRFQSNRGRFVLCTDLIKRGAIQKIARSFPLYEYFIKDTYISQKYAIYDTTTSKKSNIKSVSNNAIIGGQVASACAVGKVVDNNQKLKGSDNVYIVGLPTLSMKEHGKTTLNTTISLLNGYIFSIKT